MVMEKTDKLRQGEILHSIKNRQKVRKWEREKLTFWVGWDDLTLIVFLIIARDRHKEPPRKDGF